MTDLQTVLERLSNAFGPSGREQAVRVIVREMLAGRVDRMETDAMGNLLAHKSGVGPEPRLRIMLAAHMDEVGFMVVKVEKSGLLKFHAVGGLEARQLLGKRVLVGDQLLPGIIGAPVPHLAAQGDDQRFPDLESLAIDIGAINERGANGKVKAGDYGTFATRFTVLSDEPAWPTVLGKAFDDRAGCAALVSLLNETYPVDLIGAFTVQEEVGLRGARVAGYRTKPDAAIILEGTVCDDSPQPEDEDESPVTRLGDGPAITLMDRRHVSHPGLLQLLRETAEAEAMRIQYKAPGIGGTDAGAIHLAHAGVPAVTVAIPCRYIHGPAAILNVNDLTATVSLVGAALRRIQPGHLTRPDEAFRKNQER
jgi:endoglucanase